MDPAPPRTFLEYPIGEWVSGLVGGGAYVLTVHFTDGWVTWGVLAGVVIVWVIRTVICLLAALFAR